MKKRELLVTREEAELPSQAVAPAAIAHLNPSWYRH